MKNYYSVPVDGPFWVRWRAYATPDKMMRSIPHIAGAEAKAVPPTAG